jgi:hypothetical protein
VSEALPDFRTFYSERHGVWPARLGEPYDDVFKRLAETMADYADELRKRSAL